jgi:hypothetical protein
MGYAWDAVLIVESGVWNLDRIWGVAFTDKGYFSMKIRAVESRLL